MKENRSGCFSWTQCTVNCFQPFTQARKQFLIGADQVCDGFEVVKQAYMQSWVLGPPLLQWFLADDKFQVFSRNLAQFQESFRSFWMCIFNFVVIQLVLCYPFCTQRFNYIYIHLYSSKYDRKNWTKSTAEINTQKKGKKTTIEQVTQIYI